MKNRIVIFVVFVCCLWTMPGIVRAQLSVHQFDQLMKKIDDVLWYEKVGDIAHVDKVILCLSLIHISEPRDRQKSRMPSSA